MTLGKRAILYLTRKKGRSILLAVLIFVMSSFVLVGMTLKTGADAETEKLQKSLGGSFILKADTNNQSLYEPRSAEGYSWLAYIGPVVTENMVNTIMKVDGVEDYAVSTSETVWADLKLRPGLWADSEESEDTSQEEVELRQQVTLALPCRKGELHTNFRTGAFSIIDGRNIEEADYHAAVVSDYLAEQNGLSVGDQFIIESREGIFQPSDTPSKTWGEPIELEIVGLFQANFEQEASIYTPEESYADNLIFTDLGTETELKQYRGREDSKGVYGEVVFFVDQPGHLDSIMEQIKRMDGLDLDGLIFTPDDTAYLASVKPLRQIRVFAMVLIAAGIGGCALILYLVLVMWVRERKREISIFLSVGISKVRIVVQMILECFLVSAVALVLTLMLSKGITDGCCRIAERMTAPDAQSQAYTVVEEYGEMEPAIYKVSSDPVHLDNPVSFWSIFIMMLVIGMISTGSVSLASLPIMRMKPKEILQSM